MEAPWKFSQGQPTISLIGGTPYRHQAGEPFADPGFYATDPQDGAVSVTVSGNVDENTPGNYV